MALSGYLILRALRIAVPGEIIIPGSALGPD